MGKTKIPESLRLDTETLNYFRDTYSTGRYQTEINRILNEYVQKQQEKKHVIVGRAKQAFQQFYASCFWHLRKELNVSLEHVPIIQAGLRKYGGRGGFLLAAELEFRS